MPNANNADDDPLSLNAQTAIDAICDEFEKRLRAGEKPSIEDALASGSQAHRPQLLRELHKLESEFRHQCIDDEYRLRFPELLAARQIDSATSDLTTNYLNSTPPSDDALPTIPGYDVMSKLGEGAMGVVYKAYHHKLKRVVALKMMRAGKFASVHERQRFRFEAEAIAGLDHAHIVTVYDVGEVGGKDFLCLKFLDGGSLAERLKKHRYTPTETAALMLAITRGVQHAHERGFLHRDLKPGNILLDAAGQPHVADFGLARRIASDHSFSPTGAIVGTLHYMAPEQARGEKGLTVKADIYALGAILYELLTGVPPFKGDTPQETLALLCSESPAIHPRQRNAETPTDLEAICLRCVHKDPASRYASAAALADDLERFLDGRPLAAQPTNLVAFVQRIFQSGKETPTLVTLPVFWWLACMVFLFNAIIWLFGLASFPVWTVWLLQGVVVALSLGMLWWYYVLNDPQLISMERQSMAMSVAHQLAICALLVIAGPDPNLPVQELYAVAFSAFAIATGLAWFAHGPFSWGRHYVLGLAFFPLALLLRFWPPYAPLIYGTALSASLLLEGWRMRAMLNRAQS